MDTCMLIEVHRKYLLGYLTQSIYYIKQQQSVRFFSPLSSKNLEASFGEQCKVFDK